MRFDALTCRMEPRTPWGIHTERLLQLNATERVQFRRQHLHNIKVCIRDIARLQGDILELARKVKSGVLSPDLYAREVVLIEADIAQTEDLRLSLTGESPLAPLPKSRMRLIVHP